MPKRFEDDKQAPELSVQDIALPEQADWPDDEVYEVTFKLRKIGRHSSVDNPEFNSNSYRVLKTTVIDTNKKLGDRAVGGMS